MKNNYYHPDRTYVGQLNEHGQEHGLGMYSVRFEGRCAAHFENGTVQGPGVKIWEQGEKYTGWFEKNRKHGYGHHEWASGASYTGQFRNNQPDGYGILKTVHGINFIGRVTGMSAFPIEGDWYTEHGKKVDPAEFRLDHQGDLWTGEVVDGKRHGLGTLITRIGERETGVWEHGVREGMFQFEEKNFVTETYYNNGIPTGLGSRSVYYYGEVINKYNGYFASGKYHGPGEYKRHDGYSEQGNYYFGKKTDIKTYSFFAHQVDPVTRSVQRRLMRNYAPVYDIVLWHILNTKGKTYQPKILELGVGRGEHLDFWRTVFPKSLIVGLDNLTTENKAQTELQQQQIADLKIATSKKSAIIHTGVNCYDYSQVNTVLGSYGEFDIIIHDATHTTTAWNKLDLYRDFLSNTGCLITEELGCTAEGEVDTEQQQQAQKKGWKIWDTRPLHHFKHNNSFIGVYTLAAIDDVPMKLYEVR